MSNRTTHSVAGNGAYQATTAVTRPFRNFLRGQNKTNAQIKIKNSIANDGGGDPVYEYEWIIESGGDFGWHGAACPQGRIYAFVANGQTLDFEEDYI